MGETTEFNVYLGETTTKLKNSESHQTDQDEYEELELIKLHIRLLTHWSK